jgi:hypothetical protein
MVARILFTKGAISRLRRACPLCIGECKCVELLGSIISMASGVNVIYAAREFDTTARAVRDFLTLCIYFGNDFLLQQARSGAQTLVHSLVQHHYAGEQWSKSPPMSSCSMTLS